MKCKSLLVFLSPSTTHYPPDYISDFCVESSEGVYVAGNIQCSCFKCNFIWMETLCDLNTVIVKVISIKHT